MNSKRECGSCSLCCKLLPVRDRALIKPASERCPHQRHSGCAIYASRPFSCRAFFCGWLHGANTKRPDRAHYVIDQMLDYVTLETGRKEPVVQVWADTRYPLAYRDPDLMAFLELKQLPGLVRFDNKRAVLLVPSCRSADGAYEKETIFSEGEHSPGEIQKVLAEAQQ
jgi:hypothetical protein